jgi:hypothetical protein
MGLSEAQNLKVFSYLLQSQGLKCVYTQSNERLGMTLQFNSAVLMFPCRKTCTAILQIVFIIVSWYGNASHCHGHYKTYEAYILIVYDLRFSRWWIWRMPSSRMWCHVDLVWTIVSEERIASIFRVEKSTSKEPATCSSWFLACRFFQPWRWRWYVPPKYRFTQDPHGATSQKTAFFLHTDCCHNPNAFLTEEVMRK